MKIEFTTTTADACIENALKDLSVFMNQHVLASDNEIKLALPELNTDSICGVPSCKIRVCVEITRIKQ